MSVSLIKSGVGRVNLFRSSEIVSPPYILAGVDWGMQSVDVSTIATGAKDVYAGSNLGGREIAIDFYALAPNKGILDGRKSDAERIMAPGTATIIQVNGYQIDGYAMASIEWEEFTGPAHDTTCLGHVTFKCPNPVFTQVGTIPYELPWEWDSWEHYVAKFEIPSLPEGAKYRLSFEVEHDYYGPRYYVNDLSNSINVYGVYSYPKHDYIMYRSDTDKLYYYDGSSYQEYDNQEAKGSRAIAIGGNVAYINLGHADALQNITFSYTGAKRLDITL